LIIIYIDLVGLGGKNMNEINFRVSNSFLSSRNVIESSRGGNNNQVCSTNSNINQVGSTNSNIKASDRLRIQESLLSKCEQALDSKEHIDKKDKELIDKKDKEPIDKKDIDENQIESKLEELKNEIIKVLETASKSVSWIEQAKEIKEVLELTKKRENIDIIIKKIDSLKKFFPNLDNLITSLMKKYSEIRGRLGDKHFAKLAEKLSKSYSKVKSLLDSRINIILKNIGTKIKGKLGPFAKIAGIIGKAIDLVLTTKDVANIIMSDKSIEEKGIDVADLIIEKALEIGGVVVFTVIGGVIGGPIGAAVGMVVAGGIGLLEGYESEGYKFEGYKFLANKLKEIGANKVFADWIVTPVLKLFLKPS
jgi:hypothetical protein